jgi:hypothetical protein
MLKKQEAIPDLEESPQTSAPADATKSHQSDVIAAVHRLNEHGSGAIAIHLVICRGLVKVKNGCGRGKFAAFLKELNRSRSWAQGYLELAPHVGDIDDAYKWALETDSDLAGTFSVRGILKLLKMWRAALKGELPEPEKKRKTQKKLDEAAVTAILTRLEKATFDFVTFVVKSDIDLKDRAETHQKDFNEAIAELYTEVHTSPPSAD